MAIKQTIIVDELGDLRLVCGADLGDAQEIIVCSRALARASPVLRVMTYGPFAESKFNHDLHDKDKEWVIDLPEDNPQPLLDILNIIHGRFTLVPQQPTLPELYDILTLTRKYDMAAVIKPWSDAWFKHVDGHGSAGDPRLLLVAREVGATNRFNQLMTEWAHFGWLNADGEVYRGRADLPTLSSLKALDPGDLVDEIHKNREERVQFMLKQWNDAADRLLTADGSSEKRAESTYLYGKMMRAAKEHKEGKYLLSTPAQEWPFSVMTLKSFLASLTNWDEYSKRCYRDRNGYKGSSTVIDDMQKAVAKRVDPWM